MSWRLRTFDVALAVLALGSIVYGFGTWFADGPPDWQPVSVLGLLSIPLLTRYSITVARDADANVLGLTAAVLFSSDFDAPHAT